VHALQKAQTSSVVHSFFIWLSYPDDDLPPYGARLMLFFSESGKADRREVEDDAKTS
jgi:hypothetical protein